MSLQSVLHLASCRHMVPREDLHHALAFYSWVTTAATPKIIKSSYPYRWAPDVLNDLSNESAAVAGISDEMRVLVFQCPGDGEPAKKGEDTFHSSHLNY